MFILIGDCDISNIYKWEHTNIYSWTHYQNLSKILPKAEGYHIYNMHSHSVLKYTPLNQNHNEVPLHASQDGCYPEVYKQ